MRRFASRMPIAAALVVGARHVLAAPEHSGQVTFGGVPVPGATVTASSGGKEIVTATDEQGLFRFADVGEGVWMLRVDMLGFAPLSREVTVAPDTPSSWTLILKPFDEITRGLPPPAAAAQATSSARRPARPSARHLRRGPVIIAGARRGTWRFSARGCHGHASAGRGCNRGRQRRRRPTSRPPMRVRALPTAS